MKSIGILTVSMLKRELERQEDDFITVMLNGREYIIDYIKHVPTYTDSPMSHLAFVIRDGGEGEVRR